MTLEVAVDFVADVAAADAVVAADIVAASALAFVGCAAVSAAFSRAAVVDLVVVDFVDVEVEAGMMIPFLCPWRLILLPLEERQEPFLNPRCKSHLEPASLGH